MEEARGTGRDGAGMAVVTAVAEAWAEALSELEIRHPNGRSVPIIRVIPTGAAPALYVGLDRTWCTMTGKEMPDFAISTVTLSLWPGARLAQKWFAAAWAGYCQHEALELVTLRGRRDLKPLNPHDEPYVECPWNQGLRVAFPVELTWETLRDTLALVMPAGAAVAMIGWSMHTEPYL